MRTAILGSGPVGMTAALLLARQGHEVTLVDRDPGPVAGRPWQRVGVMQFHLPHGFRAGAREVLAEHLPDVFEAVLSAGARDEGIMLHVRRAVLERAMWEVTSREPGIDRLTGHVDEIEVTDGHATGVVVDSVLLASDLVVDATGRKGRPSAAYRPEGESSDCGMAYAARQYQLLPGAEPGPTNGGPGLIGEFEGFFALLFLQDDRTFTLLFVRHGGDHELAGLRDTAAFERAAAFVPGICEWVEPGRSTPIDKVRAGAGLTNSYRAQASEIHGLLAVGDAVCTTNPQGARGVTLGMQGAVALADIVATEPPQLWAARLDAWHQANVLCWYAEHLISDPYLTRSLQGLPIDPEDPVPGALVGAAAEVHPEYMMTVGPFLGMFTQPASLDGLRLEVRQMLREGWRPAPRTGPSRADLAAVLANGVS